MGKDGGIDLRNKENGIICQCKHIKKFSDLKSILKKIRTKLPPWREHLTVLSFFTPIL